MARRKPNPVPMPPYPAGAWTKLDWRQVHFDELLRHVQDQRGRYRGAMIADPQVADPARGLLPRFCAPAGANGYGQDVAMCELVDSSVVCVSSEWEHTGGCSCCSGSVEAQKPKFWIGTLPRPKPKKNRSLSRKPARQAVVVKAYLHAQKREHAGRQSID